MNQERFSDFKDQLLLDSTGTFLKLDRYSPLLASPEGFSLVAEELSKTLKEGLQKRYGSTSIAYTFLHLQTIVCSVKVDDPRRDLFCHLALKVAFSLYEAFPKRRQLRERLEMWMEDLLTENPVDGVVLPFQQKNPGEPG